MPKINLAVNYYSMCTALAVFAEPFNFKPIATEIV